MRREAASERKQAEAAAEADSRLRAAGAFRRGTGVQGPRRERRERARSAAWEEWMTADAEVLGGAAPWEELEALSAALGLTPEERVVLGLWAVEGCSLREMAAGLGTTVYRVRLWLRRARARCRRAAPDPPLTPRALFRQEAGRNAANRAC